tara:strand:+ start:497 stop:802 length:306 start_codon:yes stop_codon:yes gene_type:complete
MSDIKEVIPEDIEESFYSSAKEAAFELTDQVGKKRYDSDKRGFFDVIQEKIISRKLLVFTTATVLMWFGLDPETWGLIAICYIGGQSVIDAAQVWKHGKSI